jgi:hypothetical protein
VLVLQVLLPQGSINGSEHWAPPSTDTHGGGPPPLLPPSPEPPLLLALPSAGVTPPSSPPLLLMLPLELPLEFPLPELPPLPLPEIVLDPASLPFGGAAEVPPQWANASGTAETSGARYSQRAYVLMNPSTKKQTGRILRSTPRSARLKEASSYRTRSFPIVGDMATALHGRCSSEITRNGVRERRDRALRLQ